MKKTRKKCIILLSIFITLSVFLIKSDEKINKEQIIEFCGRFPNEEHISIDNLFWQVLETPSGFVKLLNAYLDNRWNQTVVRVNANGPNFSNENATIFCQFWFDEFSPPKVVRANIQSLWVRPDYPLPENDRLSFFIVCPIKWTGRLPVSVSLTNKNCEFAENNLKILDLEPSDGVQQEFGICVKQVTYEDREFAFRFVEWVHLTRILGASKIHIAIRFVHPDLLKVLDHFQQKDFIEVVPFLEQGDVPDVKRTWEARTLEHNALNDCFYRVRKFYKYLVVIDPDEIITPIDVNVKTWHDLLASLDLGGKKYDAYLSHNIMYPNVEQEVHPEIPGYHYILQHTQRSSTFLQNRHYYTNYKSILITEDLLSIFNHGTLECFNRNCTHYTIPDEISQLSHYRIKLQRPGVDNITIPDTTLWKFKEELVAAVKQTLDEINLKW